MSDDLKFASPDEKSFSWPASESRRRLRSKFAAKPKMPRKQPIGRTELADLKRFRRARSLARRWEAGDEEVTIQDLISVLLGSD